MARLALSLLGSFRAEVDGAPVSLPTRKAQALLAYLAMSPGQAHPRDKLAALLWGNLRESQARGSLRQALTALRRALGASGALRLAGDTVALDPGGLALDVAAFETHAAEGSDAALAEASRLYRGDLLSGLAVREGTFQEWLLSERERLHELALTSLGRLLARQRAASALDAAIETAERLVALDPLQESACRALMRLYVQAGRRSAALRAYQQCAAAIERELKAEPEAETRALHDQIARDRPPRSEPLAAVEPPAPPPPAAPGDAPLIGRDDELARLREALDAAWKGRGRLVGLVGEAGVGKSRLVTEVSAEAARRGGRVLIGCCYETERILPLAPWIDALRTARLAEDRALLDELAPPWRAQLGHLLPELGGATELRSAADPLHVFEAMAHLLERLAADRPLLVAVEDCHWSDDMSLRLIAFLSRRLEGQRIVLLGTAREEAFGTAPVLAQVDEELRRTGRVDVIHLRPLTRAEIVALAARVAGPGLPADALAAMQAEVWRTSEGNPFVALETLRALRDRGPDDGEGPLPRRVHQLIERRLEQLSEAGRTLVAVAAAVGRRFDWALLQEAAGLPEAATADGVEELVRHHVLREAGDELEFTHDRIREAAYAQLLPGRRILLHAQIGRSLEALAARDRDRDRGPLALGTHYRAGLVWDKAFVFLERAGTEAAGRGASLEAMTCFEQALDALDHLPPEPARQRQRFDLHHRALYDLYRLGRFDEALERGRLAEPLAREIGDEHAGYILVARAYTLATVARYADSIDAGEQVLAIARRTASLPLEVWSRLVLMRALYAIGRYPRVVELARWVLAALAVVPLRETLIAAPLFPAVRARTWLALALSRTGHLAEAVEIAGEAVGLADAVGDRGERAWALYCLARVLMTQGDYGQAVVHLEQTLALYAAAPVASAVPRSLAALALAQTYLGRADQAIELLERATREAEGSRALYGHSTIFVHASVAHLLGGRRDEAARAAAQALALTRERGERGEEAWALLVSADVAAAQEPPDVDGAIALYRDGLAVTRDLAIESLEARSLLGIATVYDRAGRREESRAAATRAVELFGRLGIRFWRDRAAALAGA